MISCVELRRRGIVIENVKYKSCRILRGLNYIRFGAFFEFGLYLAYIQTIPTNFHSWDGMGAGETVCIPRSGVLKNTPYSWLVHAGKYSNNRKSLMCIEIMRFWCKKKRDTLTLRCGLYALLHKHIILRPVKNVGKIYYTNISIVSFT